MSIRTVVELKQFIAKSCECPVVTERPDPAYNLGYDSTCFFSPEYVSQQPRPQLLHPVTRRELTAHLEMIRTPDFLGSATIRLFLSKGLINSSRPPSPALTETTPLISPPQAIAEGPTALPVYYQNIARGLSELGCLALFLEPAVEGMPNQNRLLVCPFLASDGGTYNLLTLAYLFKHHRPSPITGQPFRTKKIFFSRVMADILNACWNATGECTPYFPCNNIMLGEQRTLELEKYTTANIKAALLSLTSEVKGGEPEPNCCCPACGHWTRGQRVLCGIVTGFAVVEPVIIGSLALKGAVNSIIGSLVGGAGPCISLYAFLLDAGKKTHQTNSLYLKCFEFMGGLFCSPPLKAGVIDFDNYVGIIQKNLIRNTSETSV